LPTGIASVDIYLQQFPTMAAAEESAWQAQQYHPIQGELRVKNSITITARAPKDKGSNMVLMTQDKT
jgi:hypothetical protein